MRLCQLANARKIPAQMVVAIFRDRQRRESQAIGFAKNQLESLSDKRVGGSVTGTVIDSQ